MSWLEVIDSVDARRFWSRVSMGDSDSCWPWTGHTDRDGYGQILIRGNGPSEKYSVRSHRVAFFLTRKRDATGMACHSCDNPSCCNPWHLFEGTALDNNRDKVAKGRQRRGDNHASSTLSSADVCQIRNSYSNGRSIASIAREFRRSESCIDHIVHRRTWRHVP